MQGDRTWNVAHRATSEASMPAPSLVAVQRNEAQDRAASAEAWRRLMEGATAALEVPGLPDDDRLLIGKVRRACSLRLGSRLLTRVP